MTDNTQNDSVEYEITDADCTPAVEYGTGFEFKPFVDPAPARLLDKLRALRMMLAQETQNRENRRSFKARVAKRRRKNELERASRKRNRK